MSNPIREARGALAKHRQCVARCHTTGTPCRGQTKANRRRRMHEDRDGRPAIHGRHIKAAVEKRGESGR
jgi:hypothetical protein